MALFFANSIKLDPAFSKLKEYVDRVKDQPLCYIPTAATPEKGFGKWKKGETFSKLQDVFSDIRILELEAVDSLESQKVLRESKILFLAGGYPVYLSYWLHFRELVPLIREKVEEGCY